VLQDALKNLPLTRCDFLSHSDHPSGKQWTMADGQWLMVDGQWPMVDGR
jgi:hypothetical protein